MNASTPFDPYQQTFTLQTVDGSQVNVTMPELDSFVQYNNQILINYGTQLGACIVLFIVLVLLTKENKRTTPIFIVNTLAVIFNIIGNITACLYFTGPFGEVYAYFAYDYSRVRGTDYATQVATTFMWFLLWICIMTSLCLQTRAVCVTLRGFYRQVLVAITIFIALVATVLRLALSIENAKEIVSLSSPVALDWIAEAVAIVTTISIAWFCVIFTSKLGYSLHQRRKMGLGKFGPMQIIFIMGCQSLLLPVIFCILTFTTNVPAIQSNVLTSVTISLPLSSLWASASLDSRFEETRDKTYSKQAIPSYGTASTTSKTANNPLSPSSTNPASPRHDGEPQVFKDLEAQGLAGTGEFSKE